MKKTVQKKAEDEHKMQSALQHLLTVSRKKAMRATREKHMQILGMLPAAAIPKHLENVRIQAAICVQSVWRGHVERRSYANRKSLVIRTRAAIIIQRVVRESMALTS